MKQLTRDKPRAKSAEQLVLKHAERYGLTVPEAIAATHPQVFQPVSHAKQVCSRLVKADQMQIEKLYHNRRYYFLAPAGRQRCQSRTSSLGAQEPFSEPAKIRAYAMLAVCCLGAQRRTRLTKDDFQQHFTQLNRPGLPMNYYVDLSSEAAKLGFLRIDMGGHGRWDRIVAKARADAESHWMEPAFGHFIGRGSFEIRIVTPLPHKAERIHRTLQAYPSRRPIPIEVTVVPELINLIATPNLTGGPQYTPLNEGLDRSRLWSM